MLKSLRWRIQVWHALILLAVVAGLGGGLYVQARRARFDEIDAEILAGARVLEGVLRTVPRGLLRAGEGPPPGARIVEAPRFGPRPPLDRREGPPPPRRRFGGGPPPPPPPPRRGEPRGRRPFDEGRPEEDLGPPPTRVAVPADSPANRVLNALALPPDFEDWHIGDGQPPYFAVWLVDGRLLRSSPGGPAPRPDPGVGRGLEFLYRNHDRNREVTLLGPEQTRVVVGRPIGRELREMHGLAWRAGLTGLALFSVGLLGGWWLSGRAVRPISTMSQTVAGITANNLSRRLDLDGVDTELGDLGALLNVMLDRLETAFDRQVRFTADASHELRTPLAVILAQSELALSRPRTAEAYRDALAACQRAGARMSALVEDLLTLARVDGETLDHPKARVDLASLALDSAAMLQALAEARDVRLEVSEAAGPVWVIGDPSRLAQVVTNLVVNAITYNVPGGLVTVTVADDGGDAILTVADTGIGIPEADLPRLFDRFHRVDQARARAPAEGPGGNGLGLAICQAVVEAQGGTITVTSRLGGGSTFVVRLPRGGLPLSETDDALD